MGGSRCARAVLRLVHIRYRLAMHVRGRRGLLSVGGIHLESFHLATEWTGGGQYWLCGVCAAGKATTDSCAYVRTGSQTPVLCSSSRDLFAVSGLGGDSEGFLSLAWLDGLAFNERNSK